MTFQAHQGIITAHSMTIIYDADLGTATGFHFHSDLGGACIQRVFHQLLDHAGRAFNHFAGGNLVGNLFREKLDTVHRKTILHLVFACVHANLWTGNPFP